MLYLLAIGIVGLAVAIAVGYGIMELILSIDALFQRHKQLREEAVTRRLNIIHNF
jgi:hypothetical protein